MDATTVAVSKEEFRNAVGRFITGVTVLTVTGPDGQAHGMTANSFTSVSLEPLLILVCVDQNARTLPLLHARQRFVVNILAGHQQALAEYFARPELDHESAEQLGVRYGRSRAGIPTIEETLGHLDCRVVAAYPAGDHTIFIAEVEDLTAKEGEPLIFHEGRYRTLRSGRTE